ncbi:MAG: hypothetical protein PHP70_04210 [Gallionella sp.]|nr:hypothetical protein [Gallionella sp.]
MNETQRKILIATAGVVALMVIFPPYIVENYRAVTIMAGYGFLFDLPSYAMQSGSSIPASVNVKTLLVQIFGAVVVGGLAFLSAKR